jgi:hypothetical protein
MAYLDHTNRKLVIVNGVNDEVIPLPDTVVVLADKLLTTGKRSLVIKEPTEEA